MERVPVTNDTASPIYVGADMVPPGETRLFLPHLVPPHLRPVPVAAPEEAPKDKLKELWNQPARDVIDAIPGLSDEDLQRLSEMESGRMVKDKPATRTSVLAAVQEEVLKRADAAAQQQSGGDGSQE